MLIVDDSHVIRSTLRKILSDRFTVLELDSGEGIYDLIRETKVDLIILDVLLPGESGLQICKRLKNHEETSHIPIMICSSVGDKSNVLEALRNDANDFIMKPFTSEVLLDKLRNLRLL